MALHLGAVAAHADFNVVPMLDDASDTEAARLSEIFLDRVAWSATTHGAASNTYLLHPNYQDLFADDVPTIKLRVACPGDGTT